MRQGCPSDITLSITALPTRLTSPDCVALLKAVDSSVLQLHSVQSRGPACSTDTGPALEQAICAYRSSLPFYLAPPGLWFRAHRCPGQPASVESESPLLMVADKQERKSVSPRQIRHVYSRHRNNSRRIIFRYRLVSSATLDNDTAPGRLITLAAVIRHQPLTSRWQWLALPDKANASAESTLWPNWQLKHRQY